MKAKNKYKLNCLNCGNSFCTNFSLMKFCSSECRTEKYSRDSFSGDKLLLSSGTVGAISELIISADLMRKGYSIFRALSPSCFCDVIAIKNDRILKIEIRTGYVSKHNGKYNFPKKKRGNIDLYGIYSRNENICLYFDLNFNQIKL